ncbi:MAG TPA: hypothetical protein VLQ93_16200, partial [Myxococcaceae bacterium]|nr:hypothetical protein [Myxococcaceae bacterium]
MRPPRHPSHRRPARRPRPKRQPRRRVRPGAVGQARLQLRFFRKASLVAVAMTGLLLLVVGPAEQAQAQDAGVTATAGQQEEE